MSYSFVMQHDEMDCGAACLAMIGKHYGLKMPLAKYRELLCFDNNGTTVFDIVHGAGQLNMKASPLKGTLADLKKEVEAKRVTLPCIALIQVETYYHYVVIYKISKKMLKYADPADGLHTIAVDKFAEKFRNVIIAFEKKDNFEKIEYKSKSVELVKSIILRYRKLYVCIFLLSLLITILGLGAGLMIEFTVSTAVAGMEVCEEEDCDTHNHEEEESSGIEWLNEVIEEVAGSPAVVLYILILIFGLRLAVELYKSFVISTVTCKVEKDMSLEYFEKMLSLPLHIFKGRKSGDFLSRFTDMRKLNSFLVNILTTCILNITFVVSFGIILFMISRKLFMFTLIIVLIFTIFTLGFQSVIKKASVRTLQNNSQVMSNVEETIKGIEVIKTYSLEDIRGKVFKKNLEEYINELRRFANMCFCHNNIANWISSFGDFCVIYIGINMCMQNVISVSTLILYYMLSMYFMSSFKQLVYLQPNLSEMLVVFRRVEDILECESEDWNEAEEEITNLETIEIYGLNYKYGLRTKILDNVSLNIVKGDKIRILGSNGSGKSTLAHILVGNLNDYEGNILYNGKDSINAATLKKLITYVNQDAFLFHDSIINNILMGCENVTKEKFLQVCSITGVDEIANSHVEKYDYILADNGANLSGGQRQKIALARALLRDTPMYIFDESTSNLDVDSEKEFLRIVTTYLSNKTILVISHNDIYKELVNKSYIIEKGKLIQC